MRWRRGTHTSALLCPQLFPSIQKFWGKGGLQCVIHVFAQCWSEGQMWYVLLQWLMYTVVYFFFCFLSLSSGRSVYWVVCDCSYSWWSFRSFQRFSIAILAWIKSWNELAWQKVMFFLSKIQNSLMLSAPLKYLYNGRGAVPSQELLCYPVQK